MRRLVLAAALLAFSIGAHAQTGSESPSDSDPRVTADGEHLLAKLTARQFDDRLPPTGLKDWLSALLDKRAEIEWSTTDCGDEGGGPDNASGQGDAGGGAPAPADQPGDSAGSELDSPLCTEAQALFYGRNGRPSLDRYVVVQLLVGTSRRGVNLDAASYGPDALSVFLFDGSAMRTLSRLGDLPPALTALK